MVPLAEELKVHVLIETVWNGFCYKPEQFRDYIDACDSPWVQAYYDIGNMQKFAPSHEWIRILGKRTIKLDVKDWGSKTASAAWSEMLTGRKSATSSKRLSLPAGPPAREATAESKRPPS